MNLPPHYSPPNRFRSLFSKIYSVLFNEIYWTSTHEIISINFYKYAWTVLLRPLENVCALTLVTWLRLLKILSKNNRTKQETFRPSVFLWTMDMPVWTMDMPVICKGFFTFYFNSVKYRSTISTFSVSLFTIEHYSSRQIYVKSLLKLINPSIRTWFQIPSQLTKEDTWTGLFLSI